jgi:hypothetical protein
MLASSLSNDSMKTHTEKENRKRKAAIRRQAIALGITNPQDIRDYIRVYFGA